MPTNRITGILNGQRAITGDTALRLAHYFGTSAEFWLNLQSLYELRMAQKKSGKSIKALPRLTPRRHVPTLRSPAAEVDFTAGNNRSDRSFGTSKSPPRP